MAIQVWDGTKYVGAELGRFGPSGTLKEALIWDGTKYIKVWPSSMFPASGTWGPVPIAAYASMDVFSYVSEESGQFSINMSAVPGLISAVVKNGSSIAQNGRGGATVWSGPIAEGDTIRLTVGGGNVAQPSASGSWSIVKN